MAHVLAPGCEWDTIGLRPGEKVHEVLIPADESRNVLEFDNHYVIQPIQSFWGNKIGILGGVSASDGFVYASNRNCETLSEEELKVLLEDFLPSSSD
jgi:UDP-N-acetylglucosamine 4,6-dehydratase